MTYNPGKLYLLYSGLEKSVEDQIVKTAASQPICLEALHLSPRDFSFRIPEAVVTPNVVAIVLPMNFYEQIQDYPQIFSTDKIIVYKDDEQLNKDLEALITIEPLEKDKPLQWKNPAPVRREAKTGILTNKRKMTVHTCFAGSYKSIRTMYKAIKEDAIQASGHSNTGCLVMDLCPESYAPYEFRIVDPKESYTWFEEPKNKDIEEYVNETNLDEVYYISPYKASFFNSEWLSRINWVELLTGLMETFDEIYVVFGAISDTLIRNLFVQFYAEFDCMIYQDGDYLSITTMLNNIADVQGIRDIEIRIFDCLTYDVDEPDDLVKETARQANEKYKIVKTRYPNAKFLAY